MERTRRQGGGDGGGDDGDGVAAAFAQAIASLEEIAESSGDARGSFLARVALSRVCDALAGDARPLRCKTGGVFLRPTIRGGA